MNQGQKILIAPDCHLRHVKLQSIIDKERPDLTICLGDFFDDFWDGTERNEKMARWLKEKLWDKNVICLFGNHEGPYFKYNLYTSCNGFTHEKSRAINSILTPEDWKRFKWFHFLAPDLLLTHAGLDVRHCKNVSPENLNKHLHIEANYANKCLQENKPHWFFMAGKARGGTADVGGLTWVDFDDELEPYPIRQICGHTEGKDVRYLKQAICIDTKLNHYAIYQDGKIIIKTANG